MAGKNKSRPSEFRIKLEKKKKTIDENIQTPKFWTVCENFKVFHVCDLSLIWSPFKLQSNKQIWNISIPRALFLTVQTP